MQMHFPVLRERSNRKLRIVSGPPKGKKGIDYSQ